jgi:hypothetical protein
MDASERRRCPIHGFYVEKCGKGQNQFTEKLFFKNGFLRSLPTTQKPTDMTIHWKALAEHFLMVPLVFRLNNFLNFSKKPQSL